MTKSVNKFKKTLFLAHFPKFLGKNFFSRKSSCHAQLHMGFQHHANIEKKLMIQFQENTWTEGWKDGQTLFYRTLPATVGGPNKKSQTLQKTLSQFIQSESPFESHPKVSQLATQIWHFFSIYASRIDLFNLITGNLM